MLIRVYGCVVSTPKIALRQEMGPEIQIFFFSTTKSRFKVILNLLVFVIIFWDLILDC